MFERFTEKARRVLFFGRYVASKNGAAVIEPQHLLLGVMRENNSVTEMFPVLTTLRNELEQAMEQSVPVTGSADLPMSHSSKRALAFGAEEAERMNHRHIGTLHLFLGLFREKGSALETFLGKHGITIDQAREKIAGTVAAGRDEPVTPEDRQMLQTLIDQQHRAHVRDGGGGGVTWARPVWGPRESSAVRMGPFWTHEQRREFMGHEITVTEHFELTNSGKTLKYTQKLAGPGKEHQFEIEFDVSPST
jgi:hypothetical protein